MSCYKCTKKFGLLRKEYGCGNCGFSFCTNCLAEKAVVPKVDTKRKVPVCSACLILLTKGGNKEDPRPFMQANFVSVEIPVDYRNQNDQNATQDLEQRLKELKGRSAVPTHDELTERLNSLKELPPGSSRSNLSSIPPLDKRTTEEKTADLLKQITNEVDLDKNSSTPFDDIEERLARLKGIPIKPNTNAISSTPFNTPIVASNFIDPKSAEISSSKTLGEDVDEVQRLLDEAMKEANLSAAKGLRHIIDDPEAMKEYKKALSKTKLNQKKKTRVSSSESTDSESEDAEAERLAEQLRKESMLEDEKKAYSNESEFKFCSVCFTDATVRSVKDRKLYCTECYREVGQFGT